MNLRPHHLGISIADMTRSIEWYRTNLGFEVRASTYIEDAGLKIAYITNGQFEIELFEQSGSLPVPAVDTDVMESFRVRGHKHFAFIVEDVDETWHDLTKKNLDLVTPPTTNTDLGVRYCFIRDPDGIQIEFLSLL